MQITTQVDDKDFWSAVFGSGFETWSWWHSVKFLDGANWDEPGRVRIRCEDPGDWEKSITVTLNLADLGRAYSTAIEKGYRVGNYEDMDADAADVVVQLAVYGEVIFG